MARQEIVKLFDDITGEDITDQRGAGRVEFEVGGKRYEVDLSTKNQDALKEALEPFISAGRRVVSASVRRHLESPSRRTAHLDRAQLAEIRRWGQENAAALGLKPPSDKGRVSNEVLEAYREHDGQRVRRPVPPAFAAA
ncbi:histone-like nucleoid-structuring protein Lsr2 [Micromonospora maritima]|uniref:histone-like nucleoid-structuring protein Lsr2 n=1 Tax=Micromonospora maritima TaxID=986711 RepID=UPI00157C4E2F|nr:Lsr2 family protein [Micromonospora maritima]